MFRLVRHSIFLLYGIIAFCISVAQPSADYKRIDEFIRKYPIRVSVPGDIKVLAREIRSQSFNDEEKARAAFYWITHNISYDCEGYRLNNGLYELEDVLSQRKGICAGYAALMKFFCDELGVECVIVNGFATGIGVTSTDADSLKTNHAWNAVKIKGQWELVDPTWGSGSANSDCTKTFSSFDEHYFLARPEDLIITHLPDSVRWQLLDTPLNRHQFSSSIAKWKKETDPDELKDSVIQRNIGETVRFTFEKKDERNMICLSVFSKNSKEPTDLFDTLRVAANGSYYYDFKVKKPGYYRVDVSIFYYTGTESESIGTSVETYFLQVPATISRPRTSVKSN
ncbi:MAG TPA: transglutaminase domain-containing protein [Chitinophagaceae bacterium]|nr:transglutaminase domain-containing protein [Chitinophagaceae bacterium]